MPVPVLDSDTPRELSGWTAMALTDIGKETQIRNQLCVRNDIRVKQKRRTETRDWSKANDSASDRARAHPGHGSQDL